MDMASTAYACDPETGNPPPHCSNLPVYNYWLRDNPEPDHIVRYFLVNECYFRDLLREPRYDGKWRLYVSGRCEYAVWRACVDGQMVRYKLQESVWRIAEREVPDGYFIGFANRDFLDCRLDNLILIPIKTPTTVRMHPFKELDRSNTRVAPRSL